MLSPAVTQLGGCGEHPPVHEGPPAQDHFWQVCSGDQEGEGVVPLVIYHHSGYGGANYGQGMAGGTGNIEQVGVCLGDRETYAVNEGESCYIAGTA